jgi:tetratricopeptide (TPR) repeat protein
VPVVAPTNDSIDRSATEETMIRTVVPGVEIKSFAAGINEPALASVMQRAEKLLAEGRYASAIIEIDNAELLAPRDPMLKLARSIAQLGGGYYRQAEISMREALDLDQALLVARYDLVGMIGERRLETIRTDLGRIAGESPADPGPLLMLAFVAHQTEPGTRDVELLRRAQRLAPADPLLPAILRVWEVSK